MAPTSSSARWKSYDWRTRLRRLLKLTDSEAAPASGSQAAWFDRDPGPVNARSSPEAKVAFSMRRCSELGPTSMCAGRTRGPEGHHIGLYHDIETPVLAGALDKRAPGYVSLGFPDPRTR